MQRAEVTIIGLGGLGSTLAKALSVHDIPVKSLFNRSIDKAKELADRLDISIAGAFPANLSQLGDIVFITVSDQAIARVAEQLAEVGNGFEGKVCVHCSGNATADRLKPLQRKGARIASFHPLQTFTTQADPKIFEGIYFSLQGDAGAFSKLRSIAKKLGANTFEITSEQKSHLHAAAVMASNYLNTLLDAAVDVGSMSGLSRPQLRKALLPLIRTTLKNAEEHSFADTLTGPIKRGDVQTVKTHIDLLKDQPDLCRLYCVLGRQTVELAESSGSLDESAADNLRHILEGADG